MAMQYEWKCGHVEYDFEETQNRGQGAGQVKVSTLHWRCEAWDDTEAPYPRSSAIGTVSAADQNRKYPLPALIAVPEATFVKWVHQAMGDEEKSRIESSLDDQYREMVNPTHGGFTPGMTEPEQPLPPLDPDVVDG